MDLAQKAAPPPNDVPALQVSNLRRSYGARWAVDNLDLQVTQGSVYGFLGPNGAGKTTAMRCILGLIRADAGQVAIFGETDPVKRRQHVGALVETPRFYEWLSGRQNLVIACAYAGVPDSRIPSALERVGLGKRGEDKVSGYSLGMKQRLGIARALLGDPKLLMLDEPTNGLDPQGMKDVRDLVASLAKDDGLTIFISSHILKEVEAVATRVGIIQQGRLVAEGDVQELLNGAGGLQIEVGSPDMNLLRAKLLDLPGVSLVGEGENGVIVALDELDGPGLNKALVLADVPVSYLGAGRDLEDVFLSLTQSDEVA